MTKQDAITLFGSTAKLARALGVRRQAISQWPPGPLTGRREHEVIGAAVRAGLWTCSETRPPQDAA